MKCNYLRLLGLSSLVESPPKRCIIRFISLLNDLHMQSKDPLSHFRRTRRYYLYTVKMNIHVKHVRMGF